MLSIALIAAPIIVGVSFVIASDLYTWIGAARILINAFYVVRVFNDQHSLAGKASKNLCKRELVFQRESEVVIGAELGVVRWIEETECIGSDLMTVQVKELPEIKIE